MYNSNQAGSRIAEEVIGSPKTLPGTPVWEPIEPNSYGDIGSEIKTEARAPIQADRQRRKGTVVDEDAAFGYQTDLTTKSLKSTIQGFMFASWRKKTELSVTAVAAGKYSVASGGAGFTVGSLLFAEGFATAANNGLKKVTASSGTDVTVAGLVNGAETGTIYRVGVEGAAGDLTLTVVGGRVQLNATALDLTTIGLIAGEWVWIGGDAAGERFATAACNGFYRVYSVAAGAVVFDRTPEGAGADAGVGKTVRVFVGQVLKNEADPALQVKRTYQAETILDTASTKIMYVRGLVANMLKLTTKTAAKLIAELELVGMDTDNDQVAPKAGTRPAIPAQSAFSSTSDFTRLRLTQDSDGASLAVYLTDIELSIDNGVEGDKAIGTLGAVDHSVGDFTVAGSVEAYFSSMDAVNAAKANETCSIDMGLVANVNTPGVGNQAAGWLFDVPCIGLGDARLKIEKDKKIKLPLSMEAYAHETLNHTLLLVNFQYLPQLAL